MRAKLRSPEALVVVLFLVVVGAGAGWGLPGSDSWAADSISPRSCGLGAIAETFTPGHFHIYPPLHMLLLTVLSLPWMGLAALRVGADVGALGRELIKPQYMTPIEVSARLVTALMALGVLRNVYVLWTRLAGRRVALLAALLLTTSATFVYYAHTGNLDVPALFWVTLALLELDRVSAGEPRHTQALLCCVAAALTKDQAVAALIVPAFLALALPPSGETAAAARLRPLARGVVLALVAYALLSGFAVNPHGFVRRLGTLFGPASQSWAGYPPGLAGLVPLAHDALARTPELISWPVAVAAAGGLGLAACTPSPSRLRRLLPASAAASFFLLFDCTARRTEVRFLLPVALLLTPYAALLFAAAWTRLPRARAAGVALGLLALVPGWLEVASLDGALLADPRYEAERWLAGLPPGTSVEVYGGPIFLPRIPATLTAVRPGIEPVADRQEIPGVLDVVDPLMDPRERGAPVIVLATELSSARASAEPTAATPFGLMQYRDERSRAMLRHLADGSFGYHRVLRARCVLPWPLACESIHGSTAGEVWIYARSDAP
jgi:hypothetical protein